MNFLKDFLSENEFQDFINDVKLIQNKKPLIHSITNYVAMNFSANALLSIGASPVMSRAPEEVAQIASYADALASHTAAYQKQFGRVSFTLPSTDASKKETDIRVRDFNKTDDQNLTTLLFQYGRYLLISSSVIPFLQSGASTNSAISRFCVYNSPERITLHII